MDDFLQVCLSPGPPVLVAVLFTPALPVPQQLTLLQALHRINSSVSNDDVKRHEEWRDKFGSV